MDCEAQKLRPSQSQRFRGTSYKQKTHPCVELIVVQQTLHPYLQAGSIKIMMGKWKVLRVQITRTEWVVGVNQVLLDVTVPPTSRIGASKADKWS